MKRKTSLVPTKVYRYGLLSPTSNGRLVDETIYRGHQFYNRLIEIERARRAEYRAERTRRFPELATVESLVEDLTKQIETMRTAIVATKIATQSRAVATDSVAELKRLRDERKIAQTRLVEMR
jgi:hypothetical protein